MEKILQSYRKQLDLFWESERLKTFKKWPFKENSSCSALKMAESGFYFVGNTTFPDFVKCFLCDKELDGWEENEDPWKEHLNHSAKCSFAKLQKTEKDLKATQFMEIKVELVEKVLFNVAAKLTGDNSKSL